MDLSLSPEQDAVRKAVKEWVDDVVAPRALENDREERFPQEALDGLRETGFIGLSIPEAYGGGGGDPMSYVLYIEELGRGDANVRSIVSVHLGLVAGSIERWGTEEQKQQWLPRMATGEVLGCFGLTEPDFGSNPADLQATAVKQPDGGYVLNGNKIFITNGTIAGVTLFMARTGGPGAKGVSRVPRAQRHRRVRGQADPRQARPPVLRHRRAGPARRAGRARGAARRRGGQGDPRRAHRPQRRTHVAGRLVHRAGPGGAGRDGRLHDPAHAVRQADRRPPAGAGAHRRHRRRGRLRAAADLAGRRPEDPRRGLQPGGVEGEVLRQSRRRSAPPTTACRRTAATATSTSTPPGSTCATPALPRCTRAPPRSRSSSSAEP